jgi:glycosyltransferase involved in cell wall biosynthesis
MQLPKIVVVTPVKNEAWILDRFLSVTSQVADYIIVADQGSTDESVAICQNYPRVTVIQNQSSGYDEASRQQLLINKARELVPEHKIIIALDADEIIAANALETSSWQEMLQAAPGTILYFEKPDLYLTTAQCIRFEKPWPLGYVDDGAEHQPSKIHSIRIPTPQAAPKLHVEEVKILHYAMTRMDAQESKMRLYSVLEHTLRTNPFWRRRHGYRSQMDWISLGRLEASPKEWFDEWEQIGIDMHTVHTELYYWQDYEVLRHFAKSGARRFWIDDIWEFDWEKCRSHALAMGTSGIPDFKIPYPPKAVLYFFKILDRAVAFLRAIRFRM